MYSTKPSIYMNVLQQGPLVVNRYHSLPVGKIKQMLKAFDLQSTEQYI